MSKLAVHEAPTVGIGLMVRGGHFGCLVDVAERRLPRRIQVTATAHLVAEGRKLSSASIDKPITDLRSELADSLENIEDARAHLTNGQAGPSHKHLLIFLAGIRMIQMLVEPSAQDIRYRLGEIAPPAFALGIDRVAHDPKVRLLVMGHHRRRNLLRITRVRHCWVPIRRLGMHHRRVRLRIAPVCQGARYGAGVTGAIV